MCARLRRKELGAIQNGGDAEADESARKMEPCVVGGNREMSRSRAAPWKEYAMQKQKRKGRWHYTVKREVAA